MPGSHLTKNCLCSMLAAIQGMQHCTGAFEHASERADKADHHSSACKWVCIYVASLSCAEPFETSPWRTAACMPTVLNRIIKT